MRAEPQGGGFRNKFHPAERATARLNIQDCRPLRGLAFSSLALSWGLRPRLYACACFAGGAYALLRRRSLCPASQAELVPCFAGGACAASQAELMPCFAGGACAASQAELMPCFAGGAYALLHRSSSAHRRLFKDFLFPGRFFLQFFPERQVEIGWEVDVDSFLGFRRKEQRGYN